jgi:POT family proton-dependent oligopeptide transporter
LIILFLAIALFWAGYEQAGTSLQIFAERHTQRMIGGWEVPSSWFQNFQPTFVLLFAPVLAVSGFIFHQETSILPFLSNLLRG